MAIEHKPAVGRVQDFATECVDQLLRSREPQDFNQLVVKRLIDRAVDDDIAPIILGEYANTASAGSIIAFHRHRADLAAGDRGVICSFGAGYSIGSVVLTRQ